MSDPTSEYRDDRAQYPCCPYCGMGLSDPDLHGIGADCGVALDALLVDILDTLYWESAAEYLDTTGALMRDEAYRAKIGALTGRKLPMVGIR